MQSDRLHAAATAVVMWPLEALTRLADRAVGSWHRWRDRDLHREMAAGENPQEVIDQILTAAYKAFYESTPHPTA